jgi:hypothetical protein
MVFSKMTNTDKKAAKVSAETAALTEVRRAADLQRQKSEKLKALRMERDAALPAKKKAAAKKKPVTDLNLAQTQKIAKK